MYDGLCPGCGLDTGAADAWVVVSVPTCPGCADQVCHTPRACPCALECNAVRVWGRRQWLKACRATPTRNSGIAINAMARSDGKADLAELHGVLASVSTRSLHDDRTKGVVSSLFHELTENAKIPVTHPGFDTPAIVDRCAELQRMGPWWQAPPAPTASVAALLTSPDALGYPIPDFVPWSRERALVQHTQDAFWARKFAEKYMKADGTLLQVYVPPASSTAQPPSTHNVRRDGATATLPTVGTCKSNYLRGLSHTVDSATEQRRNPFLLPLKGTTTLSERLRMPPSERPRAPEHFIPTASSQPTEGDAQGRGEGRTPASSLPEAAMEPLESEVRIDPTSESVGAEHRGGTPVFTPIPYGWDGAGHFDSAYVRVLEDIAYDAASRRPREQHVLQPPGVRAGLDTAPNWDVNEHSGNVEYPPGYGPNPTLSADEAQPGLLKPGKQRRSAPPSDSAARGPGAPSGSTSRATSPERKDKGIGKGKELFSDPVPPPKPPGGGFITATDRAWNMWAKDVAPGVEPLLFRHTTTSDPLVEEWNATGVAPDTPSAVPADTGASASSGTWVGWQPAKDSAFGKGSSSQRAHTPRAAYVSEPRSYSSNQNTNKNKSVRRGRHKGPSRSEAYLEQQAAELAQQFEPVNIAQLTSEPTGDMWTQFRVRSHERQAKSSAASGPQRPASAAPATRRPEEPQASAPAVAASSVSSSLPAQVVSRMNLRQGSETNKQRLSYPAKCCEACGEDLPPTSFICDSCATVDRERASMSAGGRPAGAL